MNLFLFFFTIFISFLVVRIGGVAFEITGMERDQARFQSLSCFSGTGFTTAEAELITGHAQRRKIASYLMILGNAGLVTLIATFANSIRPVDVLEQFNFFTIPERGLGRFHSGNQGEYSGPFRQIHKCLDIGSLKTYRGYPDYGEGVYFTPGA